MAWEQTVVASVDALFDALEPLRQRGWLFRGHTSVFATLHATIDRPTLPPRTIQQRREAERASIEAFREHAQPQALHEVPALHDDFVALMVLQHYGVRTRLLDWSLSPDVAACFACADAMDQPGEVIAFDEPYYELRGKQQWRDHPETTEDGSGDDTRFNANLTAFLEAPPSWFMCAFYQPGFQRQAAQSGAFSFCSVFGRDHFEAIEMLLADPSRHHRFVIPEGLKASVRENLTPRGIAYGRLFPDTAGAALYARLKCFGPSPGESCPAVLL